MVEFRPLSLDHDRDFVVEMFVILRYESASDIQRRPGLNRFKEQWLASAESAATLRALEASLEHRQTIAEIVVVDGAPAGFLWATLEGEPREENYYELRLVAFSLKYQRQGLGGLSVHRLEEQAQQRGATAIRSTGSASKEATIRFHTSLGFVPIQTVFEKKLT